MAFCVLTGNGEYDSYPCICHPNLLVSNLDLSRNSSRTQDSCDVSNGDRQDCGFMGVTQVGPVQGISSWSSFLTSRVTVRGKAAAGGLQEIQRWLNMWDKLIGMGKILRLCSWLVVFGRHFKYENNALILQASSKSLQVHSNDMALKWLKCMHCI